MLFCGSYGGVVNGRVCTRFPRWKLVGEVFWFAEELLVDFVGGGFDELFFGGELGAWW